jgi:hypothetical protein
MDFAAEHHQPLTIDEEGVLVPGDLQNKQQW